MQFIAERKRPNDSTMPFAGCGLVWSWYLSQAKGVTRVQVVIPPFMVYGVGKHCSIGALVLQ